MRIFSYLFILLLVLLGVTFATLNADLVIIHYYFGTSKVPLSLLLVFALLIGVMMGLMVSLIMYIKLKGRNLRLRQKLSLAEEEISNLRTIPVKDQH